MKIEMRKFGSLLNGRPAGKEVALRIFQIVNGFINDKEIVLDFAGVEILTPSFADELINLLREKYGEKEIKIENTETPAVKDTMALIMKEALSGKD